MIFVITIKEAPLPPKKKKKKKKEKKGKKKKKHKQVEEKKLDLEEANHWVNISKNYKS